MNSARRKAIGVVLAITGAAALARVGMPTDKLADQRSTDLESMFPPDFGSWQVDKSLPVILPAPDVQAKLNAIYNQVLARTYINRSTGERVMLSVAYGGDQSDGMNVHLPEVCYPAQGFQVLRRRREVLDIGQRQLPVVQLSTRLGGRFEPVTYWITVGDRVVPTRTEQKLVQISFGLRGQIPDGMLIRVSSINREVDKAFDLQQRFVSDMASAVAGTTSERRLFGPAG